MVVEVGVEELPVLPEEEVGAVFQPHSSALYLLTISWAIFTKRLFKHLVRLANQA